MIIFDAEIKRAICGRGEERVAGIEYAGGWSDFSGMGIACICTLDTKTLRPGIFLEDNLDDFKSYVDGQPTAGFNSLRFDNKLLSAHGVSIDPGLHFDILSAIWGSGGLAAETLSPGAKRAWKLDNIMRHTFGLAKSGSGAMAPVLWQRGKYGEVLNYCAFDNWLAFTLLRHLFDGKPVICAQGTLPTYLQAKYMQSKELI